MPNSFLPWPSWTNANTIFLSHAHAHLVIHMPTESCTCPLCDIQAPLVHSPFQLYTQSLSASPCKTITVEDHLRPSRLLETLILQSTCTLCVLCHPSPSDVAPLGHTLHEPRPYVSRPELLLKILLAGLVLQGFRWSVFIPPINKP